MDYTTRELLQALEFRNPMRTFFANFFPVSNTHIAEILEFDVKKGRRRMAPFVAPRIGGKIMTRDGYSTHLLKTPKIAPERVMTVDDISKRSFGESIYSSKTPEERAQELFAKDLSDLEEYIQNRKEWMSRTMIIDGRIDVKIPEDSIDVQIDFDFTNRENLTGAVKWNQENSDPLLNLKNWRRKIIQKTGKTPVGVLMGYLAFEHFKNHKKVKEAMNILNLTLGKIEPRVVNPALTFCGRITELDLDIYTYDEWFIDDDGKEKAMLPENMVVVLPDKIGSFEYGGVTQMEDGNYITYEAEIVPKIFYDDRNNAKFLRLTSRPLPRPDDVDSWFVASVVDAAK